MKRLFVLPGLCFALVSATLAADPATAPAAAAAAPDFSSFKTPDDLWKHMDKLQQPPSERPKSSEEAMAQVKAWFSTQQQAADAFVKAFPDDPRSWNARMISLRASMQMRRFGVEGSPEADQQKLNEIINSPEAPATVKGEAAFMSVMIGGAKLDKNKPEAFAAFHKAAADFLEKYPEHPLASEMKSIQMQALDEDPTPEGLAMLKKLAAGSDPRQAEAAKAALERRQKQAELMSKPLDLKFTAADGQPFDIANLRGKVVLVDFWASWCGPCMMEMPNVVRTFSALHEKGFEVVGISLDQDKGAMEEAMKRQKMTWTQYFEGGGSNAIAKAYGIQTIPSAWLIDKKGMLREQGLRGEELGKAVEKLLAE